MEKALFIKEIAFIEEILNLINLMENYGMMDKMGNTMTANGSKAKNRAMGFMRGLMVEFTKANM